MDIYCLFESKQDPTLDFNIYLLFISRFHNLKITLNTRDFNEDHIYNILTKHKGTERIGKWCIFYQTTIDGEKRLYFSNTYIRVNFSVLFTDIKECLNKIYEKVKI